MRLVLLLLALCVEKIEKAVLSSNIKHVLNMYF